MVTNTCNSRTLDLVTIEIYNNQLGNVTTSSWSSPTTTTMTRLTIINKQQQIFFHTIVFLLFFGEGLHGPSLPKGLFFFYFGGVGGALIGVMLTMGFFS